MSRPTLRLAKPPPPVPFALLRRAAKQFKGSYGSRLERHENMRKWLAAVGRLGDKWLIAKPTVTRIERRA